MIRGCDRGCQKGEEKMLYDRLEILWDLLGFRTIQKIVQDEICIGISMEVLCGLA